MPGSRLALTAVALSTTQRLAGLGGALWLAAMLGASALGAGELAARYYTTGILEPDKVASGWLIVRHVAPEAEVLFLPEDAEAPPGAVPFDLPGAEWSRQAMRSTYETILAERSKEDSALAKIGLLIRAGELSYWMLEPGSPAERFDTKMRAFALKDDTEAAFAYLDEVYRHGGAVPGAP